MTAKQVFQAILIEVKQEQYPKLLLEEYNYYINKAINNYINKRYNVYDAYQQSTDDLRVLKATAMLDTKKVEDSYGEQTNDNSHVKTATGVFGAIYEAMLPLDYFHILNCLCEFIPQKNFKCYNKGYPVTFAARRLTADSWSQIINDFYLQPSYKRPYYYIHNVNLQGGGDVLPIGTTEPNIDPDTGDREYITIGGQDNVEREEIIRYGNNYPARMEVRYGTDDTVFKLNRVYIDYLKTPQYIRLTQEQWDRTDDVSQVMEFPDYVIQEIINEAVVLIMENSSNPRIQTKLGTSQTIANPPQAQPQQ